MTIHPQKLHDGQLFATMTRPEFSYLIFPGFSLACVVRICTLFRKGEADAEVGSRGGLERSDPIPEVGIQSTPQHQTVTQNEALVIAFP